MAGQTRAAAMPFVPYNLTAPTLNAPVRKQGDTSSSVQESVLADYPTQVGALWQWTSVSNTRYAWDAFNPTVSTYPSEDAIIHDVWSITGAENETCPPGYRRPTHGPIDVETVGDLNATFGAQSEVINSLYETTTPFGYASFTPSSMSNYAAGYYADGFFDRQTVKPQVDYTSTSTAPSVSIDNAAIASSGGVFINERTSATIFFPKVSYRDGQTQGGVLHRSADEHYWTSTSRSTGAEWCFVGYPRAASALAIRCVKDDNIIPPAPLPDDPKLVSDDKRPLEFVPYVGAFWKKDQTGERLIRILRPTNGGADGDWTAQVLVGEDWIVLDDKPTTDPNVGWLPRLDTDPVRENGDLLDCDYGNDADFDALHPVAGGIVPWVKGHMDANNEYIYFRIGLKSKWSDQPGYDPINNPVRYGIVVLTYKDNSLTHRIWIRQGEGDDYLMRNTADAPEDAALAGPMLDNGIPRTKAVKFSPYNLTAVSLNAQVGLNGTGTNPGIFTEYPSQNGAFFQWAQPSTSPIIRYAWDGYTMTAPAGWSDTSVADGVYWTADNETCPDGYRRPTDGQVGTSFVSTGYEDLKLSELRQSLFSNPTQGTNYLPTNPNVTLAGYYADGFFDRRLMFDPTSPYERKIINSSVSFRNKDIAHIGAVVFNVNNNASIFFPNGGTRSASGIGSIGHTVRYMTSTATQYATSTSLLFMIPADWSTMGYQNTTANKSWGLNIRCVKN
jgi:hypothetical protein